MREGLLIKFIGRWIVATVSIYAIAWLLPGIYVSSFPTAIWAGLALGFLNAILRPVLLFFTLPATIVTLGLSVLFINAFILYLVGELVEGVTVNGIWSALFGALLISILSSIINAILFPEDRKLRVEVRRH